MRHLDLFSGIGGFALAARWVGWETVGFCEIDPYCQAVLRKHWPGVPIYPDVRELSLEPGCVDIITGGFPCQDISEAGLGAGIDGERSGLWREFARLIGEIRPRYALVENVSAITFRGLLRVLGDLTEIGYDAEWDSIPAAAVGSRQLRERVWIVATTGKMDDTNSYSSWGLPRPSHKDQWWMPATGKRPRFGWGAWSDEPGVDRVAYGVPNGVDRLSALGNAIVPEIAAMIFRQLSSENK